METLEAYWKLDDNHEFRLSIRNGYDDKLFISHIALASRGRSLTRSVIQERACILSTLNGLFGGVGGCEVRESGDKVEIVFSGVSPAPTISRRDFDDAIDTLQRLAT